MENQISKIKEFHKTVDAEGKSLDYGQMTVNIYLTNGIPVMKTLNIVKQKRIRYSLTKRTLSPIPPNELLIREVKNKLNEVLVNIQKNGISGPSEIF
jgi:hypothetical protein